MRLRRLSAIALPIALLAPTVSAVGAAGGQGLDCPAPILDPTSRQYVELGLIEVPGAVFRPNPPGCEAGGHAGPVPTDYLALCIPEIIGLEIPCDPPPGAPAER